MNFSILIPVLAYLALHFTKPALVPGGVWKAISVWVVLFVVAAVVLSQQPVNFFYPKNSALQAVNSELYRLTDKPLKKGEIVLIFQGSSAFSACIKVRLLERLLREKGLPARAFLLSVPGSNHFERLELLRQWLDRLPPNQASAFQKARVGLFREILYTYDLNPLSGFVENAYSDRSIAYTSPANVRGMMATAWQKFRAPDPDAALPATVMPLITAHFLFNIFRVGTLPVVETAKAGIYSNRGSVQPKSPTPGAPRARQRAARTGEFDYAAAMLEFHEQMADPKRDKTPPVFPWMQIPESAQAQITAGFIDAEGDLTTPHISNNPRRYERATLEQSANPALRFDGGSDAVLTLLDKAEYWHDGVHLTSEGAEVFTRWLADQIAAAWPEIAGTSTAGSSAKSR